MPYTAITPNQAGFGQEQDAYLKSLLQPTGDPTSDAINRLTLMSKGSGPDDGYMTALREANQFQAAGQQREIQGDTAKAYFAGAGSLAKEGVAGAILPNQDNPYIRVAPNRLNQSDAEHLNELEASSFEKKANGVGKIAEAGFAPTLPYLKTLMTPSLQDTPAAIQSYLSPGNKAKQTEADAAMLHSQKYDGHQSSGAPTTQDVTQMVQDKNGNWVPIFRTVTNKEKGGTAPAANPANGAPSPAPARKLGHWEVDPVTHKSTFVKGA